MSITKRQAEDFVHFGEEHYLNIKMLKNMNYMFLFVNMNKEQSF